VGANKNKIYSPLAPPHKARENGIRILSADPYSWPYNGELNPQNTALIIIDMQNDFCGKGGYVDKMGYDLSYLRAPIQPIQKVLAVAREKRYFVIHTREGHRVDQSDLPENKHWRSKRIGAEIGHQSFLGKLLTRGEKGWQIIPELSPIEG